MNEIITVDGEVVETGVPVLLDDAMAGTIARAEIDMQIATAHRYPRSVKRAIDNILSLATLDEQTALENIYALKRGGKPLRGPSIRLAEIVAQQWGNCRVDARVISVDRQNKTLMAEGTFHDLETNVATRATVSRSIATKTGGLYSHDMIAVAGQAATAIARRNAILNGVPKGVWRKAVDASEQIIRGDAKTLVERRDSAIKAFAHFNLSPDQVFQIMDVPGVEDIDIDDLVTLRAIYSSLKSGEQTVEELLRGKTQTSDHQKVENPLDDKPADATDKQSGGADQPQASTAASEPTNEQEPSSAVSTDDAGSGDPVATGGAADPLSDSAPTDTAAADGAGDEAREEPGAAPAPGDEQAISLTDLERKNLTEIGRMVFAAIGSKMGDLTQVYDGCFSAVPDPSKLFSERADNIRKFGRNACDDYTGDRKLTKPEAARRIAQMIGCDVSEVL